MNTNLFATEAKQYRYSPLVSLEQGINSESNILYLPINIDTEYYHLPLELQNPIESAPIQQTLTVQIKGIEEERGHIFTHLDSATIARHEIACFDTSIINFLARHNIEAKFQRTDARYLAERYLQLEFFGFFLVAELMRIQGGEILENIRKYIVQPGKNKIEQGRRLIASNTMRGSYEEQFIYLPNWIITLNGYKFGLRIAYYDLCALIGNTSYAGLCTIAEHELKYKDTLSSDQKEVMDVIYQSLPEIFDNYALGDLDAYDALIKIENKFEGIYKTLDIHEYWKPGESLRLTIGATVARILEAKLMKHIGTTDKKYLLKFTEHGTSKTLKESYGTKIYLSKVDGGRCRNNRPTDVSVRGKVCDIDISGCYGEGLRVQEYPLGRPITIGLPLNSANNKFMTLREFLKYEGDELIPGLWFARVSLPPGIRLKYKQDFLASWFPPKDISKMPTDSDLESIDWWTEDNIGRTKIFRRQIHLGVINHDFIQWLDNIATPQQRAELMDNLLIIAAMYYPKSTRVESFEDLALELNNHTGKNTCKVRGRGKKKYIQTDEHECHAWMSLNLGDLIVTQLLGERKKHAKKTPLNELLKLIINTIYGDQVSPYFEIGNTCVGNNITARARAMAWYMEKGLHGFQTITDGCAFDLERVPYPKHGRLTSQTVIDAYAKGTDEGNFTYKPLGGEVLPEHLTKEWIEEKVLEKLRADFPNVDVLHQSTLTYDGKERLGQFGLELKEIEINGKKTGKFIADGIATHGSANYVMLLRESFTTAKYRSQSTKGHSVLAGNLVVELTNFKPAQFFLENLFNEPKAVPRNPVFIWKSILKPNIYRRQYEAIWGNSQAFPGCTIERPRLIREFSPATFTYDDIEQCESWEREWNRLMSNLEQSYEVLYLNEDGTLNYVKMIRDIDRAIRDGKTSLLGSKVKMYLQGELKGLKAIPTAHPEAATLAMARESYGIIYGSKCPPDEPTVADEWNCHIDFDGD